MLVQLRVMPSMARTLFGETIMADHWTHLVDRITPYSWGALLLAIACVVVATLLRMAFGLLGVDLPFATYFPAVLIATLFAGVPAGLYVVIFSSVIAWWAFTPHWFGLFSGMNAANFLLFIVSSGCTVVFTQLYRDGVRQLHDRDRERELLMKELQHRGRNTYAVVEAIVRNTLVHDRDSADAIAGRVRAVSSANDLINWSSTKTVRLRGLLGSIFGPNTGSRIQIFGPDIELSPTATRNLGLVIHELLTNAIKHGALSNADGLIIVKWTTDGAQVRLTWTEEGGPTVSPPQRTGFGTTILAQSLSVLSGGISSTFDPQGLRCDLNFKCQ
jgi:two-component sensor histidine kinase